MYVVTWAGKSETPPPDIRRISTGYPPEGGRISSGFLPIRIELREAEIIPNNKDCLQNIFFNNNNKNNNSSNNLKKKLKAILVVW